MILSIAPLYAGFFGLMLVLLSWRIVRLRHRFNVRMGDGGHTELMAAVRAQGNLIEYLPTSLVLLMLLEIMGFSPHALHFLGLMLVVARVLHIYGINEPSGASLSRKIGTRMTWAQIALSSLSCMAGAFGVAF